MQINLYNTLTHKKEEFIPIKKNNVSIYSCGPTVYSYAHIGNMRTYIFMDTLRRMFKYNGYTINHVMNLTDVGHLTSDADTGEDKMEKAARKEGKDPYEIAEFYTKAFMKDLKSLNIDMPETITKATDNILQMEQMVEEIIKNGYGYETSKGIYFDVSKLDKYPVLSNNDVSGQEAGARIEIDPEKRNPYDFALWIKAPENHIMKWDSPWGKSYPGWHIECSAMGRRFLGENFDIHTGGVDHIPVHHENEIAQSEALTGKKFANYWMHAAFLNVNNQKMSKSLNNFLTARDALKQYDPDVIRFLMLSGHYRIQLNFSNDLLESAKASVERLYNAIGNLENLISEVKINEMTEDEVKYLNSLDSYRQRYIEKMDDDFNTADAISVLFDLIRDINSNVGINSSKELCEKALELIRELGSPLGILQKTTKGNLEEEIEALIAERQQARKDRNFALADKIRDELKAKGIELLDTPQGVRWKKID